jgi:imidazolonepropionase-like amidohydrolase
MGTDSGAEPLRAQGFCEQLELELMVEAGLSPLEAIRAGTGNAARALKIDDRYGTLGVGKKADFIVLAASPEKDIRNTQKIISVWKNGQEVNAGPLSGR